MINNKSITEYLFAMALTAIVMRAFFLEEWMSATKVVMNVF
jgi:hypothetical protein